MLNNSSIWTAPEHCTTGPDSPLKPVANSRNRPTVVNSVAKPADMDRCTAVGRPTTPLPSTRAGLSTVVPRSPKTSPTNRTTPGERRSQGTAASKEPHQPRQPNHPDRPTQPGTAESNHLTKPRPTQPPRPTAEARTKRTIPTNATT